MLKLSAYDFIVRPIEQSDNEAIAAIIRETLTEFGANHPGTVYYDDSTDHLYELFRAPGSVYYIALNQGKIVGGAGIFPTEGLPAGTCELVKMYLIPQARGAGLGRRLMDSCIESAKMLGYKMVYLETMPELKKAISNYTRYGFKSLDKALGNSGHHGCEIWMIKEL